MYHLYVESKIRHKLTKNRLTENALVVATGERVGEG